MSNITINLKNTQGDVVSVATTNAAGEYAFRGIAAGNYTMDCSTTRLWGGVSASDVLIYKKHIAGISPLNGIYLASGDVNASGEVTATDVLLIKKRVAIIISSFPAGDWLFNNVPVTLGGNTVIQNFNGMCFGDANASYVPTRDDKMMNK